MANYYANDMPHDILLVNCYTEDCINTVLLKRLNMSHTP